MDNAFQELDYSDISAKHLKKKRKEDDINTKTRGGIIRLGIIIIIFLIALYLIFSILAKNKMITKKESELKDVREVYDRKEQALKDEEDKYNFIKNQVSESLLNEEKLNKEKIDIEANIKSLEQLNKNVNEEIKKIKDNISNLEKELEVYNNFKSQIDELQNDEN